MKILLIDVKTKAIPTTPNSSGVKMRARTMETTSVENCLEKVPTKSQAKLCLDFLLMLSNN